jgi:type I restriction enzyme S subunit
MTGATIGKIGRMCHNEAYVNQRVLLFQPTEDINKDYLYYSVIGNDFQNYVRNFVDSQTAQANISAKTLSKYKFYIPELSEQAAIASTLSALDKKIELNNKTNDNLEAQAQALFIHWFVDFEFPDKDGNPYKSSGGVMVESELGMIPEGWEVVQLNQIANITMGQSPKGATYNEVGEGTVFYQGRADFTNRFPRRRLYTTDPKRIAQKGDILLSVRAPVGDINIANEDCCIGRGLAALNSKINANSYLLYTMMQFNKKYDFFNSEGTVFGSMTQRDLKEMLTLAPPCNIIREYEEIASLFDNMYYLLDKEIRITENLRNTLLPKLMSGKIRIPPEQ